jgi:hypothetical protein
MLSPVVHVVSLPFRDLWCAIARTSGDHFLWVGQARGERDSPYLTYTMRKEESVVEFENARRDNQSFSHDDSTYICDQIQASWRIQPTADDELLMQRKLRS